ncbi:hybrid sensor histidine kinase/response regulator [Niallia nealsonii]|uniref:histidine kinase n=2 Tax=Niallia nealsonii TaxID=115979 RepID=A0A2N0YYL1_9BACI|nr:hybrid sensor histidine kinase/response regulator [Niallia nealsonii]
MPVKRYIEKSTNSNRAEVIHILMVDDLKENLLALEAVLSAPNIHLVSAKSGEEALKRILQYDFAVILLDVQMPGINGFETARLIKERKKSRNIPIIFITALSQDVDHITQGYEVGAIDYIVKPFNPEALRSKVEQFVNIYKDHTRSLKEIERESSLEREKINLELNVAKVNLHKHEALSKVIQDTLQDTIVTFNEEGYILSVNPMVEKMFGYKDSELIGTHIAILLDSTENIGKDKTKNALNSFMNRSSIGKIVEITAKRKSHDTFPADIHIGDAMLEDYHIFVCTIRDITERKEMEKIKEAHLDKLEQVVEERTLDLLLANQKLLQEMEERNKVADDLLLSEGRFKQIFEASPCLMSIFSMQEENFIAVNNNWTIHTGYNLDELNNANCQWGIFQEDKEEFRQIVGDEWIKPMNNRKVTYKTKDKSIRYALLSTETIMIENRNCVLIVLNDITERIRMEKEIYKLDRLNLVGEMAAGIAHEIRNPMTTVHGFLQMGKLNNQQLSVEHLDLMIDELDRANKIIKEFLTLAKNKTSDRKIQSLNDIIEIIYPLLNAEALLSGKRVLLQLANCPMLYLDEKEIRQLLLNIALNGLESMSNDGVLTIKTYVEQENVILEICDTGEGIGDDVLDKIGTPFFTTKDNGTGLGLAVCYSIAERHNAKIKVNTSSKGTIFSICFRAV